MDQFHVLTSNAKSLLQRPLAGEICSKLVRRKINVLRKYLDEAGQGWKVVSQHLTDESQSAGMRTLP